MNFYLKIKAETGEYWRLLNDGQYLLFAVTDDGLSSDTIEVHVKNVANAEASVVNLELQEQLEEDQLEESKELPLSEDEYDEWKYNQVNTD